MISRAELVSLVLFAPLLYAAGLALQQLPLGPTVLLGALCGVVPALAFLRRELAVLVWVPGLFFAFVVFVVAGISSNPVPGALGDLVAGWIAASPVFVGLGALYSRESPGTRAFLATLALLAAIAVAGLAAGGPYSDTSAYADLFAGLPRAQANVLGVILTGGVPSSIPFDPELSGGFLPLALLGGGGALAGLLSVDPEKPIDALGFERNDPNVPEGMYRTLFPEGRSRLAEGTPIAPPDAADAVAYGSILAAVVAASAALVLAADRPNYLLPMITIVTVAALLGIAYLAFRTRPERTTRRSPTAAAPTASPPATRL